MLGKKKVFLAGATAPPHAPPRYVRPCVQCIRPVTIRNLATLTVKDVIVKSEVKQVKNTRLRFASRK